MIPDFTENSEVSRARKAAMESTIVQEFPRTPIRSQRPSNRVLQHTVPATKSPSKTVGAAAVLVTESQPVTGSYESYGDDHDTFEFKAKEKGSYKEETKVSVTEDSHTNHHHEKDCSNDDKKRHSKGYSNGTIGVIMFVIFIVVFFVVLGGLWYCKPEYTKCEDGDDFNYVSGALYAFIIALFFIIIIGAAWWACS